MPVSWSDSQSKSIVHRRESVSTKTDHFISFKYSNDSFQVSHHFNPCCTVPNGNCKRDDISVNL